jgi:hypothetical protein
LDGSDVNHSAAMAATDCLVRLGSTSKVYRKWGFGQRVDQSLGAALINALTKVYRKYGNVAREQH